MQVNYLGFPGTLGADYIDYIVADAHVIPSDDEAHYTEKIAYLPHTYQPNDPLRPISARTPSRAEAGLPERGFVFACFNNSYKITPEMFDVWMRLLARCDGSVLWLYEGNADVSANLRKEAHARGVAPERLIFAPQVKPEDHLARHHLADLFLDTLPYNAHTTASDALWAGLPVLTCEGTAFPGRVAASLLHAVGLPELVTHNLEEYERKAAALAADARGACRACVSASPATAPPAPCSTSRGIRARWRPRSSPCTNARSGARLRPPLACDLSLSAATTR